MATLVPSWKRETLATVEGEVDGQRWWFALNGKDVASLRLNKDGRYHATPRSFARKGKKDENRYGDLTRIAPDTVDNIVAAQSWVEGLSWEMGE